MSARLLARTVGVCSWMKMWSTCVISWCLMNKLRGGGSNCGIVWDATSSDSIILVYRICAGEASHSALVCLPQTFVPFHDQIRSMVMFGFLLSNVGEIDEWVHWSVVSRQMLGVFLKSSDTIICSMIGCMFLQCALPCLLATQAEREDYYHACHTMDGMWGKPTCILWTHTSAHRCTDVHMHTCTTTYMHTHTYIHTYKQIRTYTYINARMHAFIHILREIWTCTIYMCIYLCLCMRTRTHTYIHCTRIIYKHARAHIHHRYMQAHTYMHAST
jgi:hypothetical protein